LQTSYRIAGLWRYPVASIGGEAVSSAIVSAQGVMGDRMYGLFDAASRSPATPEKDRRWHKALSLTATLNDDGTTTIRFPDNNEIELSAASAPIHLSDFFGFDVGIGKIGFEPHGSDFPSLQHRQPHFPIHLLTTGSLRYLAHLREVDCVDVRRFRPNILLQSTSNDEDICFAEAAWIGKRGRTQDVTLTVEEEATRCGMTIIPQPGIEGDPEILRTILRRNRRRLGAYCTVEKTGVLHVGDDFELT
jgi:uncharacterized protein